MAAESSPNKRDSLGERHQIQVSAWWAPLIAAAILLLTFTWVASQGMIWYDVDSDWVKQPALVKLMTGRFAAPMAEGNIPHASLVYHWYPLYPTLLSVYLSIVGTSYAAHLWFDLGVNALAAGVGAWWLTRVTRSGWIGAIYLLGAQYLVAFKFGRPETLTSLAVTLAAALMVTGGRQYSWLVGILLGGAVAASYPAGLACCAAWAAFVVTQEGTWRAKLELVLVVAVLAMLTTLVIWLYVVYPHWREAVEALVYNTQKLGDTITGYLRNIATDVRLGWPMVMALVLLSLAAWNRQPLFGPLNGQQARLVRGAFWAAMAYLAVLFILLRRPALYYFPPLAHLMFPPVVYLAWRWLRWSDERCWSWAQKIPAVLFTLVAVCWLNAFLVRAALLPLGWTADSMTPQKVNNLIQAIVPRSSTLGGDGKLLAVVGTNWNFISLGWTGTNNWPEYVVSPVHPRTMEPTLYSFKSFGSMARERFEREYEPLTTNQQEHTPCALADTLRRWGWPVPKYRNCDWFVRIWKRRGVEKSAG